MILNPQQPTTFGKVITSDIAKKVVINIIDMILGGAPSTVILNDVRRKWEIDVQTASDLIDAIDTELNQMAETGMNRADKINEIYSKLGGANPVGLIYQRLSSKLNKLESANKADSKRTKELENERKIQANEIANATNKLSVDLGTWAVDKPDELFHEVVKGD